MKGGKSDSKPAGETREMLDPALRAQVFTKYDDKCHVCGYAVRSALRIHHVHPRHLGGPDRLGNLSLLCSNCHAVVHGRVVNGCDGDEMLHLRGETQREAAQKRLEQLVAKYRRAKIKLQNNGNVWQHPYEPSEAIGAVAKRNKLDASQKMFLTKA